MFRSVLRFSVIVGFVLCASIAISQAAFGAPLPADTNGSAGLSGTGSVLAIPAAPVAPALSGSSAVTQAQVADLNQKVSDLTEVVRKLNARLDAGSASPVSPSNLASAPKDSGNWQENRVKDLEERVNDQATFNKQVARWINGEGGPVAASGNSAVQPPKSGTLLIRNDMAAAQDVVINGGSLVRVEPRAVKHVPVPVGSITTQIRGEAALTWSIGAPNYTQEIIIAPASRNPLDSTPPHWAFDPLAGSFVLVR